MLTRILLLIFLISFGDGIKIVQHEDICGHLNNRRIYLELGDVGYLTVDQTKNDLTLKNLTNHNECNLEIITCPSCLIHVKFT